MPIKWGPQADQKLLLKILESQPALVVNFSKVAELWTEANDADRPSPRAIQDRLRVVRKQAGINTRIRTTGTKAKLSKTPEVRARSSDSEMPDTQSPDEEFKFLHSNFKTPYQKANENQASKSKNKKRKRDNDSSEEDEMSASGSDSDSDFEADMSTAQDPASLTATRSSERAKNAKPRYNFKDLQSSGDEDNAAGSDESDAGYDPAKERKEEEAKLHKRSRARRTGNHVEMEEM